VIVRLTGCHRRCAYCDTEHAFHGGASMTVGDVLARVRELGPRTVLVTGGEPLLQTESRALMQALLDDGRRVVLETSGTTGAKVGLAEVPAGVMRVVDLKTPASGIAADQIDWAGMACLGSGDEVKVVCCDRADYEWARGVVREGRLSPTTPVTFSPVWGRVAPADLAEWILADGLDVRLQVQLHRIIWPDRERGV